MVDHTHTPHSSTSSYPFQFVEVLAEPLVWIIGSFLAYLGDAFLQDPLNTLLFDVILAVLHRRRRHLYELAHDA